MITKIMSTKHECSFLSLERRSFSLVIGSMRNAYRIGDLTGGYLTDCSRFACISLQSGVVSHAQNHDQNGNGDNGLAFIGICVSFGIFHHDREMQICIIVGETRVHIAVLGLLKCFNDGGLDLLLFNIIPKIEIST